jgi:lipoprotein-anchoring transpeptidase ErfK/SrfK
MLPAPAVPAALPPPGAAESVRVVRTAELRAGGRRVGTVRARTPYGSATRLWVRARSGSRLKVSSMDAPRGAGWIAAAATRPAAPLVARVRIDRSAKRLTVTGPRARWSTRVIVGAAATPTPLGTFQVTDRLRGSRFGGVYGAWVLVLSAYGSPARVSRVAVHGMPPAARSRFYSAGCVRVPARALARLARAAPAGTPVQVVE